VGNLALDLDDVASALEYIELELYCVPNSASATGPTTITMSPRP
jgi:hypothetical protein